MPVPSRSESPIITRLKEEALAGIAELGVAEYLTSIRNPNQEVRRALLAIAQHRDTPYAIHEAILRWVNKLDELG